MSDKTEDPKENGEAEQPKRGRPTGKAKPKRMNYADELKTLQTKVKFAASILKRAVDQTMHSDAQNELIRISLDTLEQE